MNQQQNSIGVQLPKELSILLLLNFYKYWIPKGIYKLHAYFLKAYKRVAIDAVLEKTTAKITFSPYLNLFHFKLF